MDLLEYAALQMKKGKSPAEVRKLLVQNGYPVYEVENALSVAETNDEEKKSRKLSLNSLKIKAPGYVLILGLSGVLLVVGIVTLILYFF